MRLNVLCVLNLKNILRATVATVVLLSLILLFILPVRAADNPILYEYLSSGQDGSSDNISGANWGYMQFTVGDVSHTVTSINLYLKRYGSPGTVTVSLRKADSDLPIDDDLLSTTFDGDVISTSYTKYSLTKDANDEPINESIEAGEQYAIVVRAVAGDTDDCISWGVDLGAGGLADAIYGKSTDGGLTFASTSGDALFEIWGNPCIRIVGAKVFSGYKEPGDWLIVADVNNVYVPYYPDGDSQVYFQLQLLDGSTVKGATNFRAWQRQPLAIYLNADTAATMTWGAGYKLRIQALFNNGVNSEYTFVPADWNAGNLLYLDGYVRTLASVYETYYVTTLLTSVTGQTDRVLNDEGSVIFMRGVPGLEIVRPGLFYTNFGIEIPADTGHTLFEPNTVTALGSDIYNRITEVASIFEVDEPETVLGWGLVIMSLFIGIGCVGVGHGVAGIIIGLFFAGGAGFVFGGIPIMVLGAIGFVFVMLVSLWLRKLVFPTS